jgi:hypothetical protein
MRPSILLKSLVILDGMVAVGGAAFVGLRHASDVRGDTEAAPLSETYTHSELGFSFKEPLVESGPLEEKALRMKVHER